MRYKFTIISFIFLTILYSSVLIIVFLSDMSIKVLVDLARFFPVLFLISIFSYLLRYFRWYWLLLRCGIVFDFIRGVLPYISGFAFTATPGKVGELVRIRYFKPLGVPNHNIISAFIYERFFDLVVVLVISALAASQFVFFRYVTLFVLFVLIVIIFFAVKPGALNALILLFRSYGFRQLSGYIIIFRKGLLGIKAWNNPLDIVVSFILGFFSWTLISISFVLLLGYLDIDVPMLVAFSIYPLSMLAGAMSMLPGGVGGTETVTIVILSTYGVSLEASLLAAVGIRVATLWFAIICGLASLLVLEYRNIKLVK